MASACLFAMMLCLTSGVVFGRECRIGLSEKDIPCCPSGWTQLGTRCFSFTHSAKTWLDAELDCISQGANLASIHSVEEHNFLRGMINKVAGSYKPTWIGGMDGNKEGVWQWSDGTKNDYTNWYKGEPNNLGGEDCAEMNFRDNLWNDAKCTHKFSYVCAKKI